MRHTGLWSCTHIPNIIDLSRKKQLFDLEVKGQGPMKVIMVYDTPPYGHAPTYQLLTYLERQKCYGPDKKILFKKILFDLEVKGHGPTKVIAVRDTPPYGHAPTYQISLTHLERNNYLTLRSNVKVPRRSLWYVTPPYGHAPTYQISLTYLERQKYGPNKKILFKKPSFDLEVKGQGPRRSLRYATHCLMVMHPHIKYH